MILNVNEKDPLITFNFFKFYFYDKLKKKYFQILKLQA